MIPVASIERRVRSDGFIAYRVVWRDPTGPDLRLAIITWIERTYHRRRRQARLGRLTPIEDETINIPRVALAA